MFKSQNYEGTKENPAQLTQKLAVLSDYLLTLDFKECPNYTFMNKCLQSTDSLEKLKAELAKEKSLDL